MDILSINFAGLKSFTLLYLLCVNFSAAVFFCVDKYKAKHHLWRVPEAFLHLLELLGGVFSVVVLMHTIHHKNKKASYFLITYFFLALWLFILGYIYTMVVDSHLYLH